MQTSRTLGVFMNPLEEGPRSIWLDRGPFILLFGLFQCAWRTISTASGLTSEDVSPGSSPR
jgi:hypothetical protein